MFTKCGKLFGGKNVKKLGFGKNIVEKPEKSGTKKLDALISDVPCVYGIVYKKLNL